MKSHLRSPLPPSCIPEQLFEARGTLESLFQESGNVGQLLAKTYTLLAPFIPFDYLMLVNPISEEPKHAYFYPSQQKGAVVRFENIPEQDNVLLNSDTSLIIRVGNQNAHSITVNRVCKILPDTRFSIMFLRNIIKQKYIATFSFISRKQDAFNDEHVAYLFLFSTIITDYWNALKIREQTKRIATYPNLSVLSLTDLPGMRDVMNLIWKVSRQDCPVLLLGETGTGKEIVADAIHRASTRRDAPFIKVNCGGIPDTLVDSEMFGHERGAFTGAINTVKGHFERADRGMLLLDELGELPLSAQTRLLRVLQEGVIQRVGGGSAIHIDVRVLAATHSNLAGMVDSGNFRQDLLYRLNVFPILISPLRERPSDIDLLSDFFVYRKCMQQGILDLPRISAKDRETMRGYHWPGNIRELYNVIERAVILWGGGAQDKFRINLHGRDIFLAAPHSQPDCRMEIVSSPPGQVPVVEFLSLDDMVRNYIGQALRIAGGKIHGKGGAANLLRINPNTLRGKMKKLGVSYP